MAIDVSRINKPSMGPKKPERDSTQVFLHNPYTGRKVSCPAWMLQSQLDRGLQLHSEFQKEKDAVTYVTMYHESIPGGVTVPVSLKPEYLKKGFSESPEGAPVEVEPAEEKEEEKKARKKRGE